MDNADLYNPTKRQRELMVKLKIPYYDGLRWDQAKVLIKEAQQRIKKLAAKK
jgi:hypothetical protein